MRGQGAGGAGVRGRVRVRVSDKVRDIGLMIRGVSFVVRVVVGNYGLGVGQGWVRGGLGVGSGWVRGGLWMG